MQWGWRTLRKASFSLAKVIFPDVLGTRESLKATSEQRVYLGAPITFRSLFPSTVCRENLWRLCSWDEDGFGQYSSQKSLKEILHGKCRTAQKSFWGKGKSTKSPVQSKLLGFSVWVAACLFKCKCTFVR